MKILLSLPPCSLHTKASCAAVSGLLRDSIDGESHTLDLFADPPNRQLGSGGGSIHLLESSYNLECAGLGKSADMASSFSTSFSTRFKSWLSLEKRILLHAGGSSRRLPSYGLTGKCSISVPLSPFTRGQHIGQTLLSFQVPLLEKILKSSPPHFHTLMACGDVFVQHHGDFFPRRSPDSSIFDDADIICFGVQVALSRLKNHGVLFMKKDKPYHLDFMLQKPAYETIQRYLSTHHCFIDTGIWLFSDRAVLALRDQSQEKCTNSKNVFCSPYSIRELDLYADFGSTLGMKPTITFGTNLLKTCVVPLHEAQFFHFGTNLDMIASTLGLQREAKARKPRRLFHFFSSSISTSSSVSALRQSSSLSSPKLSSPAISTESGNLDGGFRHSFSESASVSHTRREEAGNFSLPTLPSPSDFDDNSANEISVFIQNSKLEVPLQPEQTNLWIENSHIASGWRLNNHSVITGVPFNEWNLTLPSGVCVDIVPVFKPILKLKPCLWVQNYSTAKSDNDGWFAIRLYGFYDTFRGSITDPATTFIGSSLEAWLHRHGLNWRELLPEDCEGTNVSSPSASFTCPNDSIDIYHARLFPCLNDITEMGRLLSWMINPNLTEPEADRCRSLWRELPRVSARDLYNGSADVCALISNHHQHQKEFLSKLAANPFENAFYSLNLDKTAQKFSDWLLPPPLLGEGKFHLERNDSKNVLEVGDSIQNAEKPYMLLAHHSIFCSRIADHTIKRTYANPNWSRTDEDAICKQFKIKRIENLLDISKRYEMDSFEALRSGMLLEVVKHRQRPKLSVHEDQIVWARSPARVDLSGGWSDTPPYSILHGGSVINLAVELNGQPPIHVYVKLCQERHILVHSVDAGTQMRITSYDMLARFGDVGSCFAIPQVALALAGFLPQFAGVAYPDLETQLKEDFGGYGIELTLFVAIPTGSGLGTSSIVAGTVLQALSNFSGLRWDADEVCRRVLILEQLLTTGGGWQDQYGGLFGGIKLIESVPGFPQEPSVRWLPDLLFSSQYAPCHLLYYTGITRTAKNILFDIVRSIFWNDDAKLRILFEMRRQTMKLYDAISCGDFHSYGHIIAESWRCNKELNGLVSSTELEKGIIEKVSPHVLGLKLTGAGGGGYMYMVSKSEDDARRIREILTSNPPNKKARFVEMQLSNTGIQVSRS